MTTNATYKRYNGTGWEIFYFKTSAGQVGVSSTRKFITSSTTVNGKAFQLAADGSDSASVSIDAADISAYTGDINYLTDGMSVKDALEALDTACKAAYDHVPTNVLTTDSQLSASKLVGTISESNLPDYILGQLMYGGTLGESHIATLSSKAKAKLGVTSNTLVLYNLHDGSSTSTPSPNSYTANEGIYYIVTVAQSFATLDLNVGDWLVATASGWQKIDNTDAIASWCDLTGNITTAQAKTALGGSIASGNNGFVTGGDVYNYCYSKNAYEDIKASYLNLKSVTGSSSITFSNYAGTITFSSYAFNNSSLRYLVDNTSDLGSSEYQWKDLYLSGNANIGGKINNLTLPSGSGTLAKISDMPTVTTSSSAPASPKAGDIWFDTSN